jgi:hypothetical protein
MAADKQAGQNAVDDLVVADDDPTDFLAHRTIPRDELLGPLLHTIGHAHKRVPDCNGSISK